MLFASKHNQLPLSSELRATARDLLDRFAANVNAALSDEQDLQLTEVERNYVRSIRASSDLGNRKRRDESLEQLLSTVFALGNGAQPVTSIAPMSEGLFDEFADEDQVGSTDI